MLSEESKPHSVQELVEILREGPDPGHPTVFYDAVDELIEQYEEAIRDRDQATVWMAEARADSHDLKEQLETQVGLIRDLASELASVSDIAAAPDGDYERWLRGLLARADAAVTGSGEPGV